MNYVKTRKCSRRSKGRRRRRLRLTTLKCLVSIIGADDDNFNSNKTRTRSYSYERNRKESSIKPPQSYTSFDGKSHNGKHCKLSYLSHNEDLPSLLDPFLFQMYPPRNFITGVTNGFSNIFKGALASIASIIILPFVSVKLAPKLLSGLLVGTLGGAFVGVASFTLGILSGLFQVSVALLVLPAQVLHYMKYNYYRILRKNNNILCDYYPQQCYSIDGEYVWLEQLRIETDEQNRNRMIVAVKDPLLYNVLNVTCNSTQSEIKRAYYTAAKVYHPDKNPQDPVYAANIFRHIHTAYQVLSDEEKRKAYDKYGQSIMKQTGDTLHEDSNGITNDLLDRIDAHAFFAIFFGVEKSEPYVGQLRISTHMISILDLAAQSYYRSKDGRFSQTDWDQYTSHWKNLSDIAKLSQMERTISIAIHLKNRTSSFAFATVTEESFRRGCTAEAFAISTSEYGGIILGSIADALDAVTADFLAEHNSFAGWKRVFTATRKILVIKKRMIGMYREIVTLVANTWSLVSKGVNLSAQMNNTGFLAMDDESKARFLKLMPTLVQKLAWSFSDWDISFTVKNACTKVLSDTDVPLSLRIRQAKGISILASEFRRFKRDISTYCFGSLHDMKTKVEEALRRAGG